MAELMRTSFSMKRAKHTSYINTKSQLKASEAQSQMRKSTRHLVLEVSKVTWANNFYNL